MLTKTDVANLALGKLGHSHVVPNLDTDQTTIGKVLRRQLKTAISTVVEMHPWGFLTSYDALSWVADQPTPQWAYAYAQPTDGQIVRRIAPQNYFMHEQEYYDQKAQYQEAYSDVGTLIYTNIHEAWAEITRVHEESNDYPNHFGRAVACQLAMDSAASIITNNFTKMKDALLRECRSDLQNQIAMDLSRRPNPVEAPSPFLRVRNER